MRGLIRRSRARTPWGSAALALALGAALGCATTTAPSPRGLEWLRGNPPGSDLASFLREATLASDRLRRRILRGEDEALPAAGQLEAAVEQFVADSARALEGRPSIARFAASPGTLEQALRGTPGLDGVDVYGAFSGRWYGRWDTFPVNHHWGLLEALAPPRVYERGDEHEHGPAAVTVLAYQYAWIGDGYGLNLVATGEPGRGNVLLGHVVHVADQDMARPHSRRPHVGVRAGPGRIIWITGREVFLEEVVEVAGTPAYAITGFVYTMDAGVLRATEGFQAIYTRDPAQRPEFFRFSLTLEAYGRRSAGFDSSPRRRILDPQGSPSVGAPPAAPRARSLPSRKGQRPDDDGDRGPLDQIRSVAQRLAAARINTAYPAPRPAAARINNVVRNQPVANVWKSFAANEVTHSMAHYLTALHTLHEDRGYARVSDVAKVLEVTKGSVSTQMKHLKEKGFVVEDENRFLRLTPEGITIAREVMHNREILIQFLRSVLGVDPMQAETDACKIEHLLSKETSHQLMAMVQLLQSGGPTAAAFLESFKSYKLQCPSLEECNLCSAECLMDAGGQRDSKSS